jgi:hypothetical protein
MAAERKNLSALIGTADPAPQPRATRPDRPAKPASPAKTPPPRTPAPPTAPPAGPDMTMRSWYMPKASADRLAGLVDDIHFATRLPKHLIMGAVVNVLDRHREEIEAEARSAGGQ